MQENHYYNTSLFKDFIVHRSRRLSMKPHYYLTFRAESPVILQQLLCNITTTTLQHCSRIALSSLPQLSWSTLQPILTFYICLSVLLSKYWVLFFCPFWAFYCCPLSAGRCPGLAYRCPFGALGA